MKFQARDLKHLEKKCTNNLSFFLEKELSIVKVFHEKHLWVFLQASSYWVLFHFFALIIIITLFCEGSIIKLYN